MVQKTYNMREELLRLRPAAIEDAELVFGWRNLPSVVAMGLSQRTVTWDEHLTWFGAAVRGDALRLHIIEFDGKAVGTIRFQDVGTGSFEVSIYLLPEYTGRGLGVCALKRGCCVIFAQSPAQRVLAIVRADNQFSASAFRKAGFMSDRAVDADAGFVRFLLERPGRGQNEGVSCA